MTSEQKSNKKPSKFSYLSNQGGKQRLLAHYQNQGQCPTQTYKRHYETSSLQIKNQSSKQKQSKNRHLNSNRKTTGLAHTDKGQIGTLSNKINRYLNNRLMSFSNYNNAAQHQLADYIEEEQKQPQKLKFQQDHLKERSFSYEKMNKMRQPQVKHQVRQNSAHRNRQKDQFSPYKQRLCLGIRKNIEQSEIRDLNQKNRLQFHINRQKAQCHINQQKAQQLQIIRKSAQNRLLDQLQEQNSIIKSQLKEFQFQSQLLKQKVRFLQAENSQIRKESQVKDSEIRNQFRQREAFYHEEIESLKTAIMDHQSFQRANQKEKQEFLAKTYQLQLQNQVFYKENQLMLSQKINHQAIIQDLKDEVQIYFNKIQFLQNNLEYKNQTINILKSNLELCWVNHTKTAGNFDNNRRRKSLDLSTDGRRVQINKNSIEHFKNINPIPQKVSLPQKDSIPLKDFISQKDYIYQKDPAKQASFDFQKDQNQRNRHIGRLMTKTPNNRYHQNYEKFRSNIVQQKASQNLKNCYETSKQNIFSITYSGQNLMKNTSPAQKRNNLIESIKSMYAKVTNRQLKDLKQLWKWLKLITHQHQSFTSVYNLRDSINSVFDYFQARKHQIGEENMSVTQKETSKIITKLIDIFQRNHVL